MNGWDMWLLGRRITAAGFRVHSFRYQSIRRPIEENAARLVQFLEEIDTERFSIVAHSLGGLVTRAALANQPDKRLGCVVTLGTPHQGSTIAQQFQGARLRRHLPGKSLAALAQTSNILPESLGGITLGALAGHRPLGMGRLLGRISEPSDGTVLVRETTIPDLTDYRLINANHMGLLTSREAADQTIHFLRHHRFF